jgi:hypothetical protein
MLGLSLSRPFLKVGWILKMVYGIPNLSPSVTEEKWGCQEKKSGRMGKRKEWIFLLLGREDFTYILRVGGKGRDCISVGEPITRLPCRGHLLTKKG